MLEFTFVYGENGYELAKDLRNSIFGAELSDKYEGVSYHLVGYDKIKQIAVARFTMISDTVCHIDFVAVDESYRRQYVGDLAVKAIEDKAKALGAKEAVTDTPYESAPFFEYENYEYTGKEREIYGKNCKIMKKDLTKVRKCRGCV